MSLCNQSQITKLFGRFFGSGIRNALAVSRPIHQLLDSEVSLLFGCGYLPGVRSLSTSLIPSQNVTRLRTGLPRFTPILSRRNANERIDLTAWRSLHQASNARNQDTMRKRKSSTLYYLAAVGVLVVGGSYAAVPLYRIFCQSYSYGGTTGTHDATRDLSNMKRINKEITIKFNADRSSSLMWNFRPEQHEIIVTPGETALAFYRAENKTSRPVDGISTYNVIPFEAGQYFNKIQCFCFEEQRLNPGETVELPVFFYIDPEFAEDPKMEFVDQIILSYTFFESKDMPGIAGLFGAGGFPGHGGPTPKKLNVASAAA